MPSLESQLLATIEGRLKKLALADPTLVFRKRHGSAFSTAGDPDLTGLWNGIHWEMELKVPGNEPTPLQWHRLGEWKRAGALTFVVHSLQEFDVAIFTIMRAVVEEKSRRPA